jgi:hypothetical protein
MTKEKKDDEKIFFLPEINPITSEITERSQVGIIFTKSIFFLKSSSFPVLTLVTTSRNSLLI